MKLTFCGGLALLLGTVVGTLLVTHMQQSPPPSAVAGGVLALLLFAYFASFIKELQVAAGEITGERPLLLAFPAGILLIHTLFGFGTDSWQAESLARLVVFLAVPLLCVVLAHRQGRSPNLLDGLCVLALWLPFDMGWIKEVWLFPKGEGAYILNAIVAVPFAVFLLVGFRRLEGVGLIPQLNSESVKWWVIYFLAFFAVALPMGIATEFIHYNGSILPWKTFAGFFGILLFIAVPEELLFRGLIQNMLQQRMKSQIFALVFTAVIFGLSHLNNGAFADWRYALLATIAGLIYGAAYQRLRNLTVPVLIHTTVDAVWIGYFM